MDMLEKAKHHFTESSENGYQHDAMLAQAAAMIAIAEELRTLNATLHDATDLNGAIKVTLATDGAIKNPGEEHWA